MARTIATLLRRRAPFGALVLTTLALAACADRDATSLLGPDGPSMQVASAPVVNTLEDHYDGACDDTDCSLREAIWFASSGATITFSVTGTIAISNALGIDKDLTIEGPGASSLTIDASGGSNANHFTIYSPATLSGMTLTGGKSVNSGGSLYIVSAPVTLRDMVLSGNTAATNGGAIFIYAGTLILDSTTVSDNSAGSSGGGIESWEGAHVIVNRSTISGNTTTGSGGGLRSQRANLILQESTVSGNSAANGAGVFVAHTLGLGGDTTTIINSTFSGNTATVGGGGLATLFGVVRIDHSTITGNQAARGGGVWSESGDAGGRLDVQGTVIAGNTNGSTANDVDGDPAYEQLFNSLGHNLIGAAGSNVNLTATFAADGDQTGVANAQLGSLADNGGPTQTHALLPESPAIDAGTCTDVAGETVTNDQRGITRPQGSTCDIGAYELESAPSGPVVNSVADPGTGVCDATECTLREAIDAAASGEEITFDPALTASGPRVINLAYTLNITRDVTITGPGAKKMILQAPGSPNNVTVFYIAGVTVSISGLGVSNGYYPYGGGMYISSGANVTINECEIAGNTAAYTGGGINNRGILTLTNSVVSGNNGGSVGGGGINNEAGGVATVVNSVIGLNQAPIGAGILSQNATLIVKSSTIVGNTGGQGAGIQTTGTTGSDATLTLVNSTVTDNRATMAGGGIYNSRGVARLILSTITGNRAGDGSYASPGGGVHSYNDEITRTVVKGSIIWGNTLSDGTTASDVGAGTSVTRYQSLGYNLIGVAGQYVSFDDEFNATGDQTNVASAGLGSLGDNGGPTGTIALLSGSPAIDQIPAASCTDHDGTAIDADQRGVSRPQNSLCDIGAFEAVGTGPVTPTFTFDLAGLSKTYGDAPFSVAGYASTNSSGAISFALGTGSTGCSVSAAGEVTITGAAVDPAACIIEASLAAASPYASAGPISQSFHIAKAQPTVSISNLPGSGSVGGGFTPTYTTASNGTTSTASSTPSVCSVSAGTVSFIASGTCTLVAHVAEGTDYLAGDGDPQSVEVSPAGPVIPSFSLDLSSLSKTYGDAPFSLTDYVTTNSTGQVTFAEDEGSVGCTVSSAGEVTITGAAVDPAACIIEATMAAAAPYAAAGPISASFHIAKAATTITISNLPASGGVTGGFSPEYTTASDGDKSTTSSTTDVCTVMFGRVSFVGIGTCTVTAHVDEGTNWLAADGAAQDIEISGLTPEFAFDLTGLSKTYGDAPFSVAGYTNTNSSGAITFALGAGSSGCTVSSAGEVTITGAAVDPAACIIEATLAQSSVHVGAGPISQSFHIAKASPSVSIGNLPSSGVVGDGFMPTVVVDGDGATSVTSSTTDVCTVDGAGAVSFDAAGTCTLVGHVAEGTNYLTSDGEPQSFTIIEGGPAEFSSSCTFRIHPRSGQMQVFVEWANADPGVSLVELVNGMTVEKELTPTATGTYTANLKGEEGGVSYRLWGGERKKADPTPLMSLTICTEVDPPVD